MTDRDNPKITHNPKRQILNEFTETYDRLFPKVFAYIAYRVGSKQDAEDLVAETFLSSLEGLGSFEWRHSNSLDAWIFTIARNLLKNHYRENLMKSTPIQIDQLINIVDNSLSPDEIAITKEKNIRLRDIINNLSPRQQEVVTLKFFGGLRNFEIAEILNLEEKTVGSYLCRAIDVIQKNYRYFQQDTSLKDQRI